MEIDDRIEDSLLFAYVDGELDEAQQGLVGGLISRDPEARERVAQIHSLHRLLRAAYSEHGEMST